LVNSACAETQNGRGALEEWWHGERTAHGTFMSPRQTTEGYQHTDSNQQRAVFSAPTLPLALVPNQHMLLLLLLLSLLGDAAAVSMRYFTVPVPEWQCFLR
jgi:hypothetical protein